MLKTVLTMYNTERVSQTELVHMTWGDGVQLWRLIHFIQQHNGFNIARCLLNKKPTTMSCVPEKCVALLTLLDIQTRFDVISE